MHHVKEGFKGQRIITLTEEIIGGYLHDPFIRNLYPTKIGFFPAVKYHYNNKPQGTDYAILLYCVAGEGWYAIDEQEYKLEKDQYIILPPHIPYSFGANESNPWTIYWLHFKGDVASTFTFGTFSPRTIQIEKSSRLQDRLNLFEEIYANLEMCFNKESYAYACACLYQFMASFVWLNAFRNIRSRENRNTTFIRRVFHYMQENIDKQLSLQDMSAYFGYSVSHFSMLFQKETGHSPIDYYIKLKIQRACQYMELTDLKINQIYPKVGFEDAAYFTRVFTKIMGESPSVYRNRERQAAGTGLESSTVKNRTEVKDASDK